MPETNRQPLTFFSLPLEIRTEVYGYWLVNELEFEPKPFSDIWPANKIPNLSLLWCTKEITTEVLSLLPRFMPPSMTFRTSSSASRQIFAQTGSPDSRCGFNYYPAFCIDDLGGKVASQLVAVHIDIAEHHSTQQNQATQLFLVLGLYNIKLVSAMIASIKPKTSVKPNTYSFRFNYETEKPPHHQASYNSDLQDSLSAIPAMGNVTTAKWQTGNGSTGYSKFAVHENIYWPVVYQLELVILGNKFIDTANRLCHENNFEDAIRIYWYALEVAQVANRYFIDKPNGINDAIRSSEVIILHNMTLCYLKQVRKTSEVPPDTKESYEKLIQRYYQFKKGPADNAVLGVAAWLITTLEVLAGQEKIRVLNNFKAYAGNSGTTIEPTRQQRAIDMIEESYSPGCIISSQLLEALLAPVGHVSLLVHPPAPLPASELQRISQEYHILSELGLREHEKPSARGCERALEDYREFMKNIESEDDISAKCGFLAFVENGRIRVAR
ncbi:hypothetical protein TWF751_002438 [Orbilia oligospora]|nr:hypothetical protein TWF751_002438 [Orbilia oligospora]